MEGAAAADDRVGEKRRHITRFIKPWLEMSRRSERCNVMVLDVPTGLTVNISFYHGYHSILVASQW